MYSVDICLSRNEEIQFLKRNFSTIESHSNLICECINLFNENNLDFVYLLDNEEYTVYPADNIIDAKLFIIENVLYHIFSKEYIVKISNQLKYIQTNFITIIHPNKKNHLISDKIFLKIKNKMGMSKIYECINIILIYDKNNKISQLAIAENNVLFVKQIQLYDHLKISINTKTKDTIDRWQPIY